MHPVQHWTGDADDANGLWDFAKSVAPWTMISRTASHPQGIIEGSIAIPHIVSRRWTAKADSQVGLTGFFHNTSANGDGTNGRIYLNGTQVYQCHTDGIRQDFNFLLDIKTGDLLDFVVDAGNANDTGSDTTNFTVSIWQDPVAAVAPFPSVRFLRGQVLSRVDGLGISGTPQLSFFVVTNPTANGRILHTGENKGTEGKSIAFLPDSSIRYNNGNKIFGDDTLYNAWNVGSYFVDTSKGYADGEFLKNGEPAIETSGVTATIQVDLPETGNETRVGAGRATNGLPGDLLSGNVAELLLLDTVLDAAGRNAVHYYFSQKFGIETGANPDNVASSFDASATGTFIIHYHVKDGSGNLAAATRTVIVEGNNPPTLALDGGNPMDVALGGPFEDPGATAIDIEDGDLTAKVQVDASALNIASVGTYDVVYSVKDSGGAVTTVKRSVVVADLTPPVITLKGDAEVPYGVQ